MEFGCLEENIKYDITEVGFLPASRETPQKNVFTRFSHRLIEMRYSEKNLSCI
jgi:hypothetical protein